MNKKNVFKYKGYTHFDIRKRANKYLNKIQNPNWVKRHGFYPFIHYKITFNKYIDINGKREKSKKDRGIFYSSHIDRYIYQYYADKLNDKYNNYAKSNGINKSVIAYRKGFKGKNNIHFAKEVFEFLVCQKRALVIVGDFTNFFDSLDHNYLKKMISKVQGSSELKDDEYKVFKNITKYTYIKLKDIELEKNKKKHAMSKYDKYYDTKQFQEFKKHHLYKNKNDYGIPQGSAISSVYSNTYMIEFDRNINSYITGKHGLYRRYCDDFIIIVPLDANESIQKTNNIVMNKIFKLVNDIPNLELHPKKTQMFSYNSNVDQKFEQLEGYSRILDYLGFSFDGKTVKLREKSLFKYYSRTYKKVKTLNNSVGSKNYNAIKKSLFKLYTHLGDKRFSDKRGNFITYARKAHEIMSSSLILESAIYNQYKRHWNKIIRRIC